MPTYRYIGKGTYVNTLKGISVKEGETFETRYILDNFPELFERMDDKPEPYVDYSEDFTLQAGETKEISKDEYFDGLNTIVAYKVSQSGDGNKAYIYVDQESDKTDNIIDDNSIAELRVDTIRGIQKLILKADENNSGEITVRVSFGWKVR